MNLYVGDTAYFINILTGVVDSGNYRGSLDGKTCLVINGQNRFFNDEEVFPSLESAKKNIEKTI